MKTYEDFLVFLDDHLKSMTDFIPARHRDFHAVCAATGRFLLSEPYRWEKLLPEWPKEPEVERPGKDEMLAFFKEHKGLTVSFRKELAAGDMEALGKAYDLMFSILVLKDELLTSVFREDIKRRRYKRIYRMSTTRLKRVEAFIDKNKGNEAFLDLMRKFTRDLEGFSLTLINNRNLLHQAIDKIQQA